jgi:hypothetical protein
MEELPMKRRSLLCLAATAAAALAAACGGGGSGSAGTGATGTLSVSLTDNPCDYQAVFVTVAGLRVHRSADAADGDAGWRDVPLKPQAAGRRVDLLTLQNGALLGLGDVELEAGSYTQLRLVLAENAAGGTPANELVLADGRRVPLTTPSAQRSGVKLIHPFEVKPGELVDLTLDFDACKSIVVAGNSGRYLLKPTIAVIPMTDVGRIVGHVPPGSLVSAQLAAPGTSPTTVKTTIADGAGRFALSPLPARARDQGYSVVITKAGNAASVIGAVPVVAQADTVVSTAASPIDGPASEHRTLVGRIVLDSGLEDAEARALQVIDNDGRRVEIAAARPDAASGTFRLSVPKAASRLATWPPAAPGSVPVPWTASSPPPAGQYVVQATAVGRLPVERTGVDATAPTPPVDVDVGDLAPPQP